MPGFSKSVASAFGDDEGDVVVLLGGAEPLDLFDDRGESLLRGLCFVPPQGLDESLFAELFS